MFESDFSLEEVNKLSINAGNIIYGHDEKMEYYVERFIKSPMTHHLFFDFEGYTSWTVEQRFQHFNVHRLLKEGRTVDLIQSKDLRLILNIDKKAYLEKTQPTYLKKVTPSPSIEQSG